MSSRKVARRPAPRTVEVTIAAGDFAGWYAKALADFPTRLIVDLNSGELARVLDVMAVIIVDHNMPNAAGELAAELIDVDPYSGLVAIAAAIGEALGKVPNR